ncbi:auxin-responsive protein IAA1-like isoform X2 [Musa acuminata AAA Group]|uniref:auxin-responsive protein IAA1-like isoform X2 n=1 Tax=Musa acuminata AAA Group TaxID=214697 RepID=UPI0031DEE2CF
MSTTETGNSLTESEVSGLDYEETQLTLAPPEGSKSEPERKRGFSESVDLRFGRPALEAHAKDPASGSSDGPVSGAGKSPASNLFSAFDRAQVVGWPPVRSFRRNALRSCTYVKVAVDGTPYLRKVDLDAYAGYQQLLTALEKMFSCFTARDYTNERRLVDPVNGAAYVPTYEDKDGDWMLVGDVPWKMFVASCKRLRLMKSSEAVNLAPRTPQGCANAR